MDWVPSVNFMVIFIMFASQNLNKMRNGFICLRLQMNLKESNDQDFVGDLC